MPSACPYFYLKKCIISKGCRLSSPYMIGWKKWREEKPKHVNKIDVFDYLRY